MKKISVTEAIERVRKGENPMHVFYEGVDSATIDPEQAQTIVELVDDAKTLVGEAGDMLQTALDASPEKTEDVENSIQSLKEIGQTLESITGVVRQNGALEFVQDPTQKSPDELRNPDETPLNEDDDAAAAPPIVPADPVDNNEMMVTLKGISDVETFKQKLIDLVQEYGGIISADDQNGKVVEEYEVDGKDTKVQDGEDVSDEVGTQEGEGDKMVTDLKSSDDKKGAVQIEHKIVKIRMTEGLRRLAKKHSLKKTKK